ncbi:MAG TPA: hypothetical protein PLD73_15470, partial [Candidatus Hydrogenedentes bacterium]|nr:hypothetical protein [Candidatus Hydrogenedentota bacterium]HPJ99819.1 hypothetical protein [Candidatus Hydrogenedentota bacterium]
NGATIYAPVRLANGLTGLSKGTATASLFLGPKYLGLKSPERVRGILCCEQHLKGFADTVLLKLAPARPESVVN